MTAPDTSRGGQFRSGLVLLLAAGHFVHDVFTAFLAPLLPLLIQKLGLSLVQAGSLAVFTQIPSVLNPLLGSLADRYAFRKLLVIVAPGATQLAVMFRSPSSRARERVKDRMAPLAAV